jgi:hypothetical protein
LLLPLPLQQRLLHHVLPAPWGCSRRRQSRRRLPGARVTVLLSRSTLGKACPLGRRDPSQSAHIYRLCQRTLHAATLATLPPHAYLVSKYSSSRTTLAAIARRCMLCCCAVRSARALLDEASPLGPAALSSSSARTRRFRSMPLGAT